MQNIRLAAPSRAVENKANAGEINRAREIQEIDKKDGERKEMEGRRGEVKEERERSRGCRRRCTAWRRIGDGQRLSRDKKKRETRNEV